MRATHLAAHDQRDPARQTRQTTRQQKWPLGILVALPGSFIVYNPLVPLMAPASLSCVLFLWSSCFLCFFSSSPLSCSSAFPLPRLSAASRFFFSFLFSCFLFPPPCFFFLFLSFCFCLFTFYPELSVLTNVLYQLMATLHGSGYGRGCSGEPCVNGQQLQL